MAFDFDQIFYDDYYGVKWIVDPSQSPRLISWSTTEEPLILPLGGAVDAFQGIAKFDTTIAQAFALWDLALDSISFVRVNAGNVADVTVALGYVDGAGRDYGRWDSKWDESNRVYKSTVRLEPGDFEQNALTTVLHEIGNILGLGDIRPSSQIRSVLEDPFPESFHAARLWTDDIMMAKQLYGEDVLAIGDSTPQVDPQPFTSTELPQADVPPDEITGVVITSRDAYGLGAAQVITGYSLKADGPILINQSSFSRTACKLKFARTSKHVDKLAKGSFEFIYDRRAGHLYFNENGIEPGFGEGGLLAVVKGDPRIGIESFVFL